MRNEERVRHARRVLGLAKCKLCPERGANAPLDNRDGCAPCVMVARARHAATGATDRDRRRRFDLP